MELKCKICDREFKTTNGLATHIWQTHKIQIQKYYRLYINKTSSSCNHINCNNDNCTWLGLNDGYRDYCSTLCSNSCNEKKDKTVKILQEKYNVTNIFQLNEVKNKIKITNIEKWGCENPSSNNEIKNKKIKTRLISNKQNIKHDKNSAYYIKSKKWRKDFANFDTYKDQLIQAEDIKSDENGYLLVKCLYCGKFYNVNNMSVNSRVSALNGRLAGEHRFYCSNGCKESCPIFHQKTQPKGFKHGTSREVDPLIRKNALERDNYECQKCEKSIDEIPLHVHHIESISEQQMLSNDIDNVITYCIDCHKEVHKKEGCKYHQLKC